VRRIGRSLSWQKLPPNPHSEFIIFSFRYQGGETLGRKPNRIKLIVANQDKSFKPSEAQIDAFTDFVSAEYLGPSREARMNLESIIDSIHIYDEPVEPKLETTVPTPIDAARTSIQSQIDELTAQLAKLNSLEAIR
jgi:hypothetical protein